MKPLSEVAKGAEQAEAAVDINFVPREHYVSPDFAELERQYLWPRTWQMVCREEDLPRIGSFVTYDILDESITIVRTSATTIQAYNNACLHRGRRLTEGEGHTGGFVCKFHGWAWNLKGENTRVVDIEDWGGCLAQQELRLHEFKVGSWGGFVFINQDPDCESFESYLGQMPGFLDCMEIDKLRYRWFISVGVESNWKTAQEAFLEGYHAQTTHRTFEPHFDGRLGSRGNGKHGSVTKYDGPFVVGRYNTGPKLADERLSYLESLRVLCRDVRAIYSDRDYQAACRILEVLPPTATYLESAAKALQFIREAATAAGAGYPAYTTEQIMRAGTIWQIFPNTTGVFGAVSSVWYRFRPAPGNDPNACIFDIFGLERFTPGSEPKVEKESYDNWRNCANMPPFLIEDFMNIPDVQRGMRTKYWRGTRLNPAQEKVIANMHRALAEFIAEGQAAAAEK